MTEIYCLSKNIPSWATALALDVYEQEENPPAILELKFRKIRVTKRWARDDEGKWYRKPNNHGGGSSGVCQNLGPISQIRVRYGSDLQDQKGVLLHELAHSLTPKHSHDKVFYDKCFDLYERYFNPEQMQVEIKRELAYKPRIVRAIIEERGYTVEQG